MATVTQPMTVERFRALPERDGETYYELHHGELVTVTRPKFKHMVLQGRLRDLLRPLGEDGSHVEIEFAFRALPEFDLRVADVAYVGRERCRQIDPEDNLRGAPDLVIEVLSPSNTAKEIFDKEKLCLENGAREFWIVDADLRQIKVTTPDGRTLTYRPGEAIPLPLFGGAKLAVDAVFA